MKTRLKYLAWLAALSTGAVASAREETLILFQDRRVSINVPEEYTYAGGRDEQGIVTVKIVDPKLKTELLARFFPDPEGRLGTEDGRKGFVADSSQQYAEASVEKSYDFKDLAPRTGSGTYCVFTDASLVRKAPLPPGEYLKVTSGVKAWPGCFFLFTLLSTDTTSEEYQTELKLLQDSFVENAPAGGPAI